MSILNPGGFISQTFNPVGGTTPSVEYLVVGGGGGGGGYGTNYYGAGGGGAGGFLTSTGYVITSGTTYNITVGAGGASATGVGSRGCAGGNSTFGTGAAVYTATTSGTITSYGGGGGGASNNQGGGTGGSGGGGGGNGGGGAAPTNSAQGFAGATSTTAGGGGGGGAGGTPVVNGVQGGYGGPPLISTISGVPRLYAAGGAGAGCGLLSTNCACRRYGGSAMKSGGGLIGGSAAWALGGYPYATNVGASPPIAGTGSGGGGSIGNSLTCGSGVGNGSFASSGASGVVIIRYPVSYSPPTAVQNALLSFAQGYRIYTWYVNGSITF